MKLERLQLRIEWDLKEWFERYAQGRGGMSRLIREHILNLRGKEGDDGRPDEDRTGDRAEGRSR